ncbi:hypothetical protein L873DRAFT_1809010 [Choiromyces venosus 120613-1]|uniref:Uncharacterized protein n=1 Tax=Choiromyces venosus 120613-1 TaxID=1336337 RepID=A0A3N4JI28_9PEZI|nr:hypothetical protein L873DRAFT_1809010 [Choiromyces venosus 120613-1]
MCSAASWETWLLNDAHRENLKIPRMAAVLTGSLLVKSGNLKIKKKSSQPSAFPIHYGDTVVSTINSLPLIFKYIVAEEPAANRRSYWSTIGGDVTNKEPAPTGGSYTGSLSPQFSLRVGSGSMKIGLEDLLRIIADIDNELSRERTTKDYPYPVELRFPYCYH